MATGCAPGSWGSGKGQHSWKTNWRRETRGSTVADPNLQEQLCLWNFPCRSAKPTAWYSSWHPNLSLLPPCTPSKHTHARVCCNSRLLRKSTPSTPQLEGLQSQCIICCICLSISLFPYLWHTPASSLLQITKACTLPFTQRTMNLTI